MLREDIKVKAGKVLRVLPMTMPAMPKGDSSHTPSQSEERLRITCNLAYYIILFIFAGLFVRLCWIQCIKHEKFRTLADKLYFGEAELPSKRGLILDRLGRMLAITIEADSVFADPFVVQDKETAAKALAEILDRDPEKLLSKLATGKRFVWIERRISEEQAERLRELDIRGICICKEEKRAYPHGTLASHVLGFTDIDNKGRAGIELLFDSCLGGTPGFRKIARDGKRQELSGIDMAYRPPRHGYSIILTIDTVIQQIVEEELDTAYHRWNPAGAMAIAMCPRTGEVLALANRPTFDPNRYNTYLADERRNRAITDYYEPGSTFKPFIVAALLQTGDADLDTMYDCHNGAWRVTGRVLHDHHPYGLLPLMDVLVKSSNIGMAQVGMQLGPERLHQCLKGFGFGQKTAIELPGEAPGFIRPLEQWTGYSIPSISMGQEIGVTAIQLATAYSAIANGGMLVRPRMVRGVADNSGKRMEKLFRFPVRTGRVAPAPLMRAKMHEVLRQVVERGTGTTARLQEYSVAGKTGTSQKLDENGAYSHTRFIGSFAAFAPVTEPQICVLVVMDEPEGKYYGGTVAAPAAGRIIKRALGYLGVKPDKLYTAQRW